jgi:uncharacterized membrane protein
MKRPKLMLAGAIAAFAVVATLIGAQAVHHECTELSGGDTLTLPDDALPLGAARLFCYRDPAGARIRFLLARDSHGDVHATFDACEQCYKYHKGYEISGDEIVCRYCGNRYKISEMREGRASCVPVQLPVTHANAKVRVKVADLQKGSALF